MRTIRVHNTGEAATGAARKGRSVNHSFTIQPNVHHPERMPAPDLANPGVRRGKSPAVPLA
jgi:hypothetical protein